MAVQRLGDPLRVLALPVHAQRHGGRRLSSIQHSSGCRMLPNMLRAAANLLDHVGAIGDRHAAQHVAEARKDIWSPNRGTDRRPASADAGTRARETCCPPSRPACRDASPRPRAARSISVMIMVGIGRRLQETRCSRFVRRADGLLDRRRCRPRPPRCRCTPNGSRKLWIKPRGAAVERRRVDDACCRAARRRRTPS